MRAEAVDYFTSDGVELIRFSAEIETSSGEFLPVFWTGKPIKSLSFGPVENKP
jgi:hypothetical protein